MFNIKIVYGGIVQSFATRKEAEDFVEWYHKTLKDYDPAYSTNTRDYVRIEEAE